jgi:hypothetical protein
LSNASAAGQRRHTLGDLQRDSSKCLWAICNGVEESGRVACLHRAPLASAPYFIRWGADASSNVMRERLRCAVGGHRGATLQHPGWMGNNVGDQPFPAEWVGVAALRP